MFCLLLLEPGFFCTSPKKSDVSFVIEKWMPKVGIRTSFVWYLFSSSSRRNKPVQ